MIDHLVEKWYINVYEIRQSDATKKYIKWIFTVCQEQKDIDTKKEFFSLLIIYYLLLHRESQLENMILQLERDIVYFEVI